jgi:hypothetical protein
MSLDPLSEYKPSFLMLTLTALAASTMGVFAIPLTVTSASFFTKNMDDIVINIIGATVGAFLGLLAAYLIYLVQTRATARIDASAALERKKEHLRYLAGILEDVVTYGKNQVKEIEDFTAKMKLEPTVIHQLAFIASESISRLSQADNESTFHAYNTIFATEAEREKDYKRMLSQTDVLTALLSSVKQSFKHYMDALYKHQLRFKSLVDTSSNEADLLWHEIKADVPRTLRFAQQEPAAIKELNRLVRTYDTLSKQGKLLEAYHNEYVVPLKEWLHTYRQLLPQRGINLQVLLRDTSVVYTDLKNESDNFLQAFDTKKLNEPLQKVASLYEKLSRGAAES